MWPPFKIWLFIWSSRVPRLVPAAVGTTEHANDWKNCWELSKYKELLFHSVTQTIFCPTVTQSQKLLLSRRVARLPTGGNVNTLGLLMSDPPETRRFLTRYHVGRRWFMSPSGVGVRLKVRGGINSEKSEGVGSGRDVPSPVGGLGSCPQKKNQFCAKNKTNIMQFWASFGTSFLY